jgi:hypothetical protein
MGNVTLATFDISSNEVTHPGVQVQYVPTIYLFPAGDKEAPVMFRSRDLGKGAFVDFLHEHGRVPFSLAEDPAADAGYQEKLAGLAAASDGSCVMWRQHGDCRPDGPREGDKDLACTATVAAGASGYCECRGGVKAALSTCEHGAFRCHDKCAVALGLKNKATPEETESTGEAEAEAEATEPPASGGGGGGGGDKCPAGTFVYHSGSHCCNHDTDRDGRPVTYNSLTCKENSYVECPGGAVDGTCK